jgi:hypothetical protein
LHCDSREPPMSQLGQTLPSRGFLRHGCFTPKTGHWLAQLARSKSANSRLMQRGK